MSKFSADGKGSGIGAEGENKDDKNKDKDEELGFEEMIEKNVWSGYHNMEEKTDGIDFYEGDGDVEDESLDQFIRRVEDVDPNLEEYELLAEGEEQGEISDLELSEEEEEEKDDKPGIEAKDEEDEEILQKKKATMMRAKEKAKMRREYDFEKTRGWTFGKMDRDLVDKYEDVDFAALQRHLKQADLDYFHKLQPPTEYMQAGANFFDHNFVSDKKPTRVEEEAIAWETKRRAASNAMQKSRHEDARKMMLHLDIQEIQSEGKVRVTAGGKVRSMVTIYTGGNSRGMAGYGIGKGTTLMQSQKNARVDLIKNMMCIPLHENRTIGAPIIGKWKRTKVIIIPKTRNAGLRGSTFLKLLCMNFGIRDCTVRVVGNRTKLLNVIQAFFQGLGAQRSHEAMALASGQVYYEFNSNTGLPRPAIPTRWEMAKKADKIRRLIVDSNERYRADLIRKGLPLHGFPVSLPNNDTNQPVDGSGRDPNDERQATYQPDDMDDKGLLPDVHHILKHEAVGVEEGEAIDKRMNPNWEKNPDMEEWLDVQVDEQGLIKNADKVNEEAMRKRPKFAKWTGTLDPIEKSP